MCSDSKYGTILVYVNSLFQRENNELVGFFFSNKLKEIVRFVEIPKFFANRNFTISHNTRYELLFSRLFEQKDRNQEPISSASTNLFRQTRKTTLYTRYSIGKYFEGSQFFSTQWRRKGGGEGKIEGRSNWTVREQEAWELD